MSVALYVLDVGHGLAQVILFPNRTAILVDCGDTFAQPVVEEFLDRFVDVLLAFVATHNDRDHVGGALGILEMPKFATRDTLHRIYCLVDRGSNCEIPLLDYALRRERQGTIRDFRYGCLADEDPLQPKLIHSEPSLNCTVEFLYPRMTHNIPALRSNTKSPLKQNQTSACIRLSVGRTKVLICGDADLTSFITIIDRYGFDVRADLLIVPHHGGRIPGPRRGPTWSDIVHSIAPSYAFVSSGYRTKTTRTKVTKSALNPLILSGTSIYCTQITQHCHPRVEMFSPGVNLDRSYPVPQMSGSRNCPQAVGCAGTLLAVLSDGRLDVRRLSAHPKTVHERVMLEGMPLCLPSAKC